MLLLVVVVVALTTALETKAGAALASCFDALRTKR